MDRLDYSLGDEDSIAFNQHAYRTSPGLKRNVQVQRLALVVVTPILFIVVGVASGDPIPFAVLGAGIAVALWFAIPWLVERSVNAQLKRAATTGNLARTGAVSLTWDEVRLFETFEGMGSFADWARIRRVEESTDHIFLILGEMDAIIVPKRAGAGVVQFADEARRRVHRHD